MSGRTYLNWSLLENGTHNLFQLSRTEDWPIWIRMLYEILHSIGIKTEHDTYKLQAADLVKLRRYLDQHIHPDMYQAFMNNCTETGTVFIANGMLEQLRKFCSPYPLSVMQLDLQIVLLDTSWDGNETREHFVSRFKGALWYVRSADMVCEPVTEIALFISAVRLATEWIRGIRVLAYSRPTPLTPQMVYDAFIRNDLEV